MSPAVPGSLAGTLASFITHLSSPRFNAVGSCCLLKIGFYSSVDRYIALQNKWIGEGQKSAKEGGVM